MNVQKLALSIVIFLSVSNSIHAMKPRSLDFRKIYRGSSMLYKGPKYLKQSPQTNMRLKNNITNTLTSNNNGASSSSLKEYAAGAAGLAASGVVFCFANPKTSYEKEETKKVFAFME